MGMLNRSILRGKVMKKRLGFTLIELLVVISIMAIVFGMGLAWLNVSASADRVRAAATETASFIEGARHRAMRLDAGYAGVRLNWTKETTPAGEVVYARSATYVRRDIYRHIDAIVTRPDGTLTTGRITVGSDREVQFPEPETKAAWDSLAVRGLLRPGEVIYVRGLFYTLQILPGRYRLTAPMSSSYLDRPVGYQFWLAPMPVPNVASLELPRGVVIDLAQSQIPPSWEQSGYFDILFDSRGRPHNQRTPTGFVNLTLAEDRDVFAGLGVGHADKEGDERIVALHAKNGNVMTCRVDTADHNGNGTADDPFNFALLGKRAR